MKSDITRQYAYGRSPLYCLMDRGTTEITSCGFWMDLDGSIDAPEYIHTGCTYSSDKNGPRYFKAFVPRDWSLEEEQRRNMLAQQLIDEILAEENETKP
jgi:hypothetical protein